MDIASAVNLYNSYRTGKGFAAAMATEPTANTASQAAATATATVYVTVYSSQGGVNGPRSGALFGEHCLQSWYYLLSFHVLEQFAL